MPTTVIPFNDDEIELVGWEEKQSEVDEGSLRLAEEAKATARIREKTKCNCFQCQGKLLPYPCCTKYQMLLKWRKAYEKAEKHRKKHDLGKYAKNACMCRHCKNFRKFCF